jgi:hypothetical protein
MSRANSLLARHLLARHTAIVAGAPGGIGLELYDALVHGSVQVAQA